MFCYICGRYSTKEEKLPITNFVKYHYHAYFGCQIPHQDKSWAPHIVCKGCVENLRKWVSGVSKCMPFGVPMIWRESTNHVTDCYFCMTKVCGFTKKTESQINYPSPSSVSLPVPHSDEIPIPNKPPLFEEAVFTSESSSPEEGSDDMIYEVEDDNSPKLFSQEELDDLVRDLDLPKISAELLGSRMKERNLLAPGTTYSWYRHREREFVEFFTLKNFLVYCHNVGGLISQMGHTYDAKDWRLFIDSSKRSLKAVLLYNGSGLASIPVAHSVHMQETYADMQILLSALKYNDHKWLICGDLKMLAILLGLQGGYTKYPCFLCLWDSRADSSHYTHKVWPKRKHFIPGSHNVKDSPLIDPKKVLLPPLHIKLGLMKNYVKALNEDSKAFKYLTEKFPQISDAKKKAGIFIGPQIRELLKDDLFPTQMSTVEKKGVGRLPLSCRKFSWET
jgi:hypothetical protein